MTVRRLFVACLVILPTAESRARTSMKPNVLFIAIDDLND